MLHWALAYSRLPAIALEGSKASSSAIQVAPMLEPDSAIHSALSSEPSSCERSIKHCYAALGEAVGLGNELDASLGTCFLFTVSNSL
jgi:hypothetical protein